MEARAHPHIFALNYLYGTSKRLPKIAQIACECGSGGTCCRVFVNAPNWKVITRVEKLRGLGIDQADRCYTFGGCNPPTFTRFQALSIGVPSCATSKSCISLACSSSTRKMPSSIVRVPGSSFPK